MAEAVNQVCLSILRYQQMPELPQEARAGVQAGIELCI
jgi:hypothetical protein